MSSCVTSRAGLPIRSATASISAPRLVSTSPIVSVSASVAVSILPDRVVSVSPMAVNRSSLVVPSALATSSIAFCNASSRSSPASS